MSVHAHRFDHLGVTAVAILAESHISIHTWPEAGYAGVDVYTCGSCEPLRAHATIARALSAGRSERVELVRGHATSPPSLVRAPNAPQGRLPGNDRLPTGLADDGKRFFEGSVPGCRDGNVTHGFHISEVVYAARTPFQECLIFDTPVYGRVLVLDGIVQLSTSDEHIYHEMLVHPAMFTHPNPQRVVIVGGGDGGALREVLRHDPAQVTMIDIDEQLVRATKEHLPSVNDGAFDDPRVTLRFEDASEALRRYEGAFDVAIIDCNDAVGPSEVLFGDDFYATVARALTAEGICAVQAGSMLELAFLEQTHQRMARHLGQTTGMRLTMPSYHCGEYVFLVASASCDPRGPDAATLAELQVRRGFDTTHWSPAIHHASQVFPPRFQLW